MRLAKFTSTLFGKMECWLRGVELGEKVSFYGRPIIRRSFGSKVSIGNRCCLRSDKTSNLIGINHACMISTHNVDASILMGRNVGLSGTVISAKESIIIKDDVLCGANTVITDFDWHPTDPMLRHLPNQSKSAPVVIGNNVWLGYGVVVLKGVEIGENTVIAANSVVSKSIPANVIAGGNPAVVIKYL